MTFSLNLKIKLFVAVVHIYFEAMSSEAAREGWPSAWLPNNAPPSESRDLLLLPLRVTWLADVTSRAQSCERIPLLAPSPRRNPPLSPSSLSLCRPCFRGRLFRQAGTFLGMEGVDVESQFSPMAVYLSPFRFPKWQKSFFPKSL
jgi:hypothetical protein